jgi:hypothetical protein
MWSSTFVADATFQRIRSSIPDSVEKRFVNYGSEVLDTVEHPGLILTYFWETVFLS